MPKGGIKLKIFENEKIKRTTSLISALALIFTLAGCTREKTSVPVDDSQVVVEYPLEEYTRCNIIYTVQSDDTVNQIFNKFNILGSDAREKILTINGINNPSDIKNIEKMLILNARIPKCYYLKDEEYYSNYLYEIQPGDTLAEIGERFGLSGAEIEKLATNLDEYNTIYAGNNLEIPILDYEKVITNEKTVIENMESIETFETINMVNGDTVRGIDISEFQGRIDWNMVEEEYKKGTFSYVILRIGDTYNVEKGIKEFVSDSRFEKNLAECNKRNIPYGLYVVSEATNTEEVLNEMNSMFTYIDEHLNRNTVIDGESVSLKLDLKYPFYADFMEDGTPQNALYLSEERTDKLALFEIILTECDKIAEKGYYPGIYMSRAPYYYLKDILGDEYDFWIADYTGETDEDIEKYKDEVNSEENGVVSVQFTDSAKINGIASGVDLNISNSNLTNKVVAYNNNFVK